ncbi:DNA polymerase III subunit gamma/tau [Cognaticolwellia mytili]|uniref:DNA polymerase III subunit gamma/tau n=1 Tax=Cognaticolwellia mytili TaxID=1888913 RepID=UPI000A172E16|nr:DNA polymerase III subunit gamma/tau [Cognaticolwellia mytili]
MSYQVLARKWRPKSFNELMGQEHVVTVLVNALTQQRLHHAYLFTGTRGVGKTTIARIFAKSLNCEQGVSATPCGTCDACVDIDQGKFVDLLEIDAASRTKVDDTREILDNVQYAPTRGRYKVYLIDEVHMLSRSSFNALLKTLEEPPEHVKFILATTDPQKLPVTVLSRCLQFHLKALTVKQISDKICEILTNETVSFDDDAIALLAKAARGSMRDCLSLTDQSIAQGNGAISRNDVQQMLGGVDRDWVYKIVIALLKQDAAALMQLSLEIASYAPSYSRLSAELLQLLHQVAMAQVVETNFSLSAEYQNMLTRFCQLMSAEDVQLYYQIVLNARKDLPYADDEQAAFDMMLLRLFAFKPVINSQQLPESDGSFSQQKNEIAEQLEDINFQTQDISNEQQPNQDNATEATVEQTGLSENTLLTENGSLSVPAQVVNHDSVSEQIVTQITQLNTENNNNVQIGNELSVTDIDNGALSDEMLAIEQQASALNDADVASPTIDPPLALDSNTSNATAPKEIQQASFESPVAAAIATRNMLRSRKKSLEDGEKKSNDATMRQSLGIVDEDIVDNNTSAQTSTSEDIINNKVNVPDIATLPEQPYSEEIIDPATIKRANQVDRWAHMIDSMSLIARLRQLAIHATIDEASTDDLLILQLDQSIKHLNSDAAHKQLGERISEYLQRKVTVELNIVERTVADPYQIQSDINSKRYEYAKQVLAKDEIVIALQEQFQAELDQETIVAR